MSILPDELDIEPGCTLSLRELDPGDMLDLIEAAGSAVSGPAASAWLSYAQMICAVRAVNGVPVQMPTSKEEIRDLARRIGNKGLRILQPLFFESIPSEDETLIRAKN